MKNTIKVLLKWLAWFVICFVVIYVAVFFGGWKLFESKDPILIEIGCALVLSVFLTIINEVVTGLEKRIAALEERMKDLERSSNEK